MAVDWVRWQPLTTEPLSEHDYPVHIGRHGGQMFTAADAVVLHRELGVLLREHGLL